MNLVRKLISKPLVDLALIGAVLFVGVGLTQEPEDRATNRIVVDAGQVEQLVAQFQRAWIRRPTRQELEGLVESHVRKEVYYREALAMRLDRKNAMVRQRMRMKLEFLLEDLTLDENPTDDLLNVYLKKNPDRFRLEPEISFVQVYVRPDDRPEIEADAERVEGRMPVLDEIRSLVKREWLATQRQELKELAYDKLREGYDVTIELPDTIAPVATTAAG